MVGQGGHSESSKTLVNGDSDSHEQLQFDSIESCISDFASGKFLIVLDDASRENEGDLIIAATHLTSAKSAFMIRYTSGYLCAPLSPTRAQHLDLPPMLPLTSNSDPNRTNYTITVDADVSSVTTGISAADRATTARLLADSDSTNITFRRPGHVVPLIARAGGVRERRGHTEAAWELARLAGLTPEVGVIGELITDGVSQRGVPGFEGAGMMRARECVAFGREWGIRCCTIEDLVKYVEAKEGKLGI